jgi:hypothetical protein
VATPQAAVVDIGELRISKSSACSTSARFCSRLHRVAQDDTVLYAVAGPYLVVMVLNFMLGRIYRRQFRTPAAATAGE